MPTGQGSRKSSSDSNGVAPSSYLAYPKYVVSSALRHLPRDFTGSRSSSSNNVASYASSDSPNFLGSDYQAPAAAALDLPASYTPPPRQRNFVPQFQPPPLTALTLSGHAPGTSLVLKTVLAEEIRLLLPPRLQLCEEWSLLFSLEEHGVSLNTLYEKCERWVDKRAGCVLVIRDAKGDVFGAYLTNPPRPSGGHYYGHGECFLWRSTILPAIPTLDSLPPLPSEDTTHAQRMTTIGSPTKLRAPSNVGFPNSLSSSRSGSVGAESMRFKAFPYSGENDYLIFCEQDFLSVGGGNGHYGLWLDSSLENGISEPCPTFGNESLSEQGPKFAVLGVEVWAVGR